MQLHVYLTIVLLATTIATAAPSVELRDGKLIISGVDAKGLTVVVAEGSDEEIAARPTMAGEWQENTFTPKYPLRPGTKYRVLGAGKSLDVTTPKAAAAKAIAVTYVYPATERIPANVLRFYIHFSAPMPRGDVYDYLEVRDAKGVKVNQPFLVIDNELWNEDQTRLTILIDPGRIKQEVKPRLDLGPVFEENKKYTLTISGQWPTNRGETLGKDFTRTLTVVDPVTSAIDPQKWKAYPPKEGEGVFRLQFGRPMDRALALRCLKLTGPDGEPVAGTADLFADDSEFQFKAAAGWKVGQYQIDIGHELEDVCGNRNGQPFEVDLTKPFKKMARISGLGFRVEARR